MTHQYLKRAVTRSFLWSMATELASSVGEDDRLGVMQKLAAIQSTTAIVRIMLAECRKDRQHVDIIEPLKMEAWDALAAKYKEEEVLMNIPTVIEEIFFSNYNWLSKVKHLESNINRMVRLATDETVKPAKTRSVTDEYEKIVGKVVYEYLKKTTEAAP